MAHLIHFQVAYPCPQERGHFNTVSGNNSGNLLIDSQNASGTNTIAGDFYLDSDLKVQQAAGGTIVLSDTTLDLKNQTMIVLGNGTTSLSGVVGNSAGSGKLTVGVDGTASTGTLRLSSANTYTGDTTVRAGTLEFTSASSSNNSTIRIGSSSGSGINANINLITLTGGTTIGSVINPVTSSGSGTLTINSQNTSGTNTLSGHIGADRSYTLTQAAGGTLNITNARIGVTTNTGSDIKGFTVTFTPAASGSINHSGTIYNSTGNGNVIMNGAGTLILSNSNTYSGATTVSSGTLIASANGALGSATTGTSGITVAGGATQAAAAVLALTGTTNTDRVNNNASLALSNGTANVTRSGGTLLLGSTSDAANTTETLGALTLGTNSVIDFASTSSSTGFKSTFTGLTINSTSTDYALVRNWNGTLGTIGGANNDGLLFSNLIGFTNNQITDLIRFDVGGTIYSGQFKQISGSNFEIVAVPEPSTWVGAGLVVGLAGLALRRRQLKQAA